MSSSASSSVSLSLSCHYLEPLAESLSGIDGGICTQFVKKQCKLTYEPQPTNSGRCGRLVWRDSGAAGTERDISVLTICDIRLGKQTAGFQSDAAANIPADQCIAIQFITSPVIRGPAAVAYRGAQVVINTAEFILSSSSEVQSLFTALQAILKQTLHRQILSTQAHSALSASIPSSLLALIESGIDVTLHSRVDGTDEEILSVASKLWFNFRNDSLCWNPKTHMDDEGEVVPLPPEVVFAESVTNALALSSVSDVFVGMHDGIWETIKNQGNTVNDQVTVSIIGAQHDNINEEGFPTPIELHIQTVRASIQRLLLDAIGYANERAEEAQTPGSIQAVVVVHVDDACRNILPEYYCGNASGPITAEPASSSSTSAAELLAANSSPLDGSLNQTGVSLNQSVHPDPDLSNDPVMACLVNGLPVTFYESGDAASDPNETPNELISFTARLNYVHDDISGVAKLTWTSMEPSKHGSHNGVAHFADLTDIFLQMNDPIFAHAQCASLDPDCCMSLHAVSALVDGRNVENYRIHLSTNSSEDRIVFLDAVQHGLQNMGAAVDNVSVEHVEAIATSSPVATSSGPTSGSNSRPLSPTKKSKLKTPDATLTAAAASAVSSTLAILTEHLSTGSAKPTGNSSPKKSPTSSPTSSRLNDLSQPKPKLPPPPPVVYTPMPVVHKEPPPRLSGRTVAKLNSLSQPRKKVDGIEEEKRLKEAEVERKRQAILARAEKEKEMRKNGIEVPAVSPPARSSSQKKEPSASPTKSSSLKKDVPRSSPTAAAKKESTAATTSTVTTPARKTVRTSTATSAASSSASSSATPAKTPSKTVSAAAASITDRLSAPKGTTSTRTSLSATMGPTTTAALRQASPSPSPPSARKSAIPVPSATPAKTSSLKKPTPVSSLASTTPARTTAGRTSSPVKAAVVSSPAKPAVPTATKKAGARLSAGSSNSSLTSPMPVSSPAIVIPSPSPDPSSSPSLETYDPEAHAQEEVEAGEVEAVNKDGSIYDPENDADLELDFDFSSSKVVSSPKKAEPAVMVSPAKAASAAATPAKNVEKEDILVTLSPIKPTTPSPAKPTTASKSATPAPAAAPAKATPASTPKTPAAAVVIAESPPVASPSGSPVPASGSKKIVKATPVVKQKQKLTMFGEELDDGEEAEEDDLDDLFGTEEEIVYEDEFGNIVPAPTEEELAQQEYEEQHEEQYDHGEEEQGEEGDQYDGEEVEEVIEEVVEEVIEEEAAAVPPPSAMERVPSMDATHVASNAQVASVEAEDDFVIVQGVGSKQELDRIAASSSSSSQPLVANTASVALRRHLTPYQLALIRLESGCAFTSYSGSGDRINSKRIFMWFDPRPRPRNGARAYNGPAETQGAIFWCAYNSSAAKPVKWASDEQRIDITNLSDVFMGRQSGVFLRSDEFSAIDDALCYSLISTDEDTGATVHSLDLAADSEEDFHSWMDAFNLMLQGPLEEDFQAEKEASAAGSGSASAAPAASPSKLPPRIAVPFIPEDAVAASGDVLLPTHISSAPMEPHSTKLLEFADFWDKQAELGAASQNEAIGAWCLAQMRNGCGVQLFERHASGSIVQSRHLLQYRPHPLAFDEEGYPVQKTAKDVGSLFLASLQSSVNKQPKSISPLTISEVVLGKFGGVFLSNHSAAPLAVQDLSIQSADSSRCLSLVIQHREHLKEVGQSYNTSIDVEFDSIRNLLQWVIGLKYLLLHVTQPTLALYPKEQIAKAPSAFTALVDSFVKMTDAAVQSSRFANEETFHKEAKAVGLHSLTMEGCNFITMQEDAQQQFYCHPIHVLYSFENVAQDGAAGSLYWNEVPSSAPGGFYYKSAARRIDLRSIRAVHIGTEGSKFFQKHGSSLVQHDIEEAQVLSLYTTDDLLRWCFVSGPLTSFVDALRSALSLAGRSLIVEENSNEQWLHVTGINDATANEVAATIAPAEYIVERPVIPVEEEKKEEEKQPLPSMDASHVEADAHVASMEAEDDFVLVQGVGSKQEIERITTPPPTEAASATASSTAGSSSTAATSAPATSSASSSTVPVVAAVAATTAAAAAAAAAASAAAPLVATVPAAAPSTFVPPVETADFLSAAATLAQGRQFYSYYYSAASLTSSEPVVARKLVSVFFSRDFPPSTNFDVKLFDLPPNEKRFPALYAVEHNDTSNPPVYLKPEDMTLSNCLSLHEISDLFLGSHNPLFFAPSAIEQFLKPLGKEAFQEESCMSIVGVASVKRGGSSEEWNLEALDPEGLDAWLEALSLMLPVHADVEQPVEQPEPQQQQPQPVAIAPVTAVAPAPAAELPATAAPVAVAEKKVEEQPAPAKIPAAIAAPPAPVAEVVAPLVVAPVEIAASGPESANPAENAATAAAAQPAPLEAEPAKAAAAPLTVASEAASTDAPIAVATSSSKSASEHAAPASESVSVALVPIDAAASNPMINVLQTGSQFLLLKPHAIGGETVASQEKVRLFYLSGADLKAAGVSLTDGIAYPQDIPEVPEGEEFVGALYYQPLEADDSMPTKQVLLADHCIPVHSLSDIFVGRETAIWKDPSLSLSKFAEDDCFSLVSERAEWNFHSITPASTEHNIVSEFLEGIAALLKTGGKDLTEDEEFVAAHSGDAATAAASSSSSSAAPAEPTTQAHLLQPDAPLELILSTLADPIHAHDLLLHRTGVQLLHTAASSFESTPESMADLISIGLSQQVLNSMRAFPDDEQLQALACGCVWILAVTSENEAKLTEQGALELILAALRKHINSASVSQQACGALRNVCVSSSNAQTVGETHGIEALLACMRAHLTDPTIQHQALGAIASLSLNANNKTHFASLGGIELILTLLRQFETDALVHEEGCSSLRNLVSNHTNNKNLVAQLGGLEVLLKSSKTFLQQGTESSAADARVNQLHCIGSLWNLTANNSQNKTLLTKIGGVETILQVMKAYEGDAEILSECCGTLRNLSSVLETKPFLFEQHVLDAVLQCMKAFPAVAIIQEQCSALLFNMSDVEQYAARIVDLEGLEALLATLQAFIQEKSIAEEVCGALWMLTRTPRVFKLVPASTIIGLSDQVLALHGSHPSVVNFAQGMRNAWVVGEKSLDGQQQQQQHKRDGSQDNSSDAVPAKEAEKHDGSNGVPAAEAEKESK